MAGVNDTVPGHGIVPSGMVIPGRAPDSNQGAAVFVVRFSVKNPSLGAELALGRAGESQLFLQFG